VAKKLTSSPGLAALIFVLDQSERKSVQEMLKGNAILPVPSVCTTAHSTRNSIETKAENNTLQYKET
jgi:hypothetical protein